MKFRYWWHWLWCGIPVRLEWFFEFYCRKCSRGIYPRNKDGSRMKTGLGG